MRSADGFTEKIKLSQGIKQGYPLSPLHYNLAIEEVLPHIEKMDGGYKFSNGTTVTILAYANDTCIFEKAKEMLRRC